MCLTTPFKVEKVMGDKAQLSDGRIVNIAIISGIKAGDWVLANADIAVSQISAKEAKQINQYFKTNEK